MSKYQPITARDGWFKGEDKQHVFDITDAGGSPQTMTGWTLDWVLRRGHGAADVVLSVADSDVSVAIGNGDGTDDRATVSINDTGTDGLAAGEYVYALKRTDAGFEQILVYGPALLQAIAAR